MPTFTRAQISQISADVEKAIQGVLDEHGLDATLRGAYGDRMELKITFAPRAEDGAEFNPNTPEALALARYAESYDLPADVLGRKFTRSGVEYQVIGLRTKAPKRPILCQDASGTKTVWPADAVARLLGSDPSTSALSALLP